MEVITLTYRPSQILKLVQDDKKLGSDTGLIKPLLF